MIIVFFLTVIVLIIAAAPIAINKLKILEPITFPITISFDPLRAATILTAASGALVPKATIVKHNQ